MEDSFKEVYERIESESGTLLRESRRKKNRGLAIGALIAILVCLVLILIKVDTLITTMAVLLGGLAVFIVYYKLDKDYRKAYKKAVIEEMVRSYDDKLSFDPEGAISEEEYKMSEFEKDVKETMSEDKVHGTILENTEFNMAQVLSYKIREYKDSDGKTQTEKVKTFDGIYGFVNMEVDSGNEITIREQENTIDGRLNRLSSKRVEMDSEEFEKYYDVYTSDRVLAYKIFTPDILLDFVDLPKRNMTHFEVRVYNNMFYFRYRCGEVFEPPHFKDPLDRETIQRYYNTIVFPIELTKKIVENINNCI